MLSARNSGFELEASPIVDEIEVRILDHDRHGEVAVRNSVGDAVEPGEIALREIDKIAHEHLAIVAEFVGTFVADAHSAFAMRQERKLGNCRHEFDRGRMQWITGDDRQRIRLENLQLTLWLDLASMAKFARHQMTVVSMIGQLKATPEVDHVDQVLDCILRADEPHVDEELAAIDVIAGHAPAHVEQCRLGSHAAGAIAAFLCAHPLFDLP